MSSNIHRIKAKIGKTARHFRKRQPAEEDVLPTFTVHFNTPVSEWAQSKKLLISGWLLPGGDYEVKALRIKNGGREYQLPYGKERHDVPKAFPEVEYKKAFYSGFYKELSYREGLVEIDVDLGRGWQTVRAFNIKYSPEHLVDMLYDADYALNWAEHANLLENKTKYYYEDDQMAAYTPHKDDPRLVTFYLPQFHPIPENDYAWGKGFTEWTNVANAKPRFVGHQQPLMPGALGFYDLRLEENVAQQVELAKKHGIHGFCFYYYWFSGERLLEKPLDIFMRHKEWDFNFMIAWANENWTKRWDGLEDDVIIAQKYLDSDPLQFIKDVEHILLDPRYIRQDGKPVLIVYRGSKLGDPAQYTKVWRKYFQDTHNMDLHILSVLGLDATDPRPFGFDAGIEFEPLTTAKRIDFNEQRPRPLPVFNRLLDKGFSGGVADYRQIAFGREKKSVFSFPTYKSVMPSWDNDARKKGTGPTIFHGANPDLYAEWLDNTLSREKKATESPLVFINAWNEWAEGAVLEPTKFNGYAYLNRTTEVLARHSLNKRNREAFPLFGFQRSSDIETAVVVHVFYEEEWRYIKKKLKNLSSIKHDLIITATERNENLLSTIAQEFPAARTILVPNRGRDVLPFIFTAQRLRHLGYKYVLKLHTKRSTHREDGKQWFESLVSKLLPVSRRIERILKELQEGTAIIGPTDHYVSLRQYLGSNSEHIKKILSDRYDDELAANILSNTEKYGYFAGSMFWARLDAFDSLFKIPFIIEEFDSERGQIDGTMAHAVERMMTVVPVLDGKTIKSATETGIEAVDERDIEENYKYAP